MNDVGDMFFEILFNSKIIKFSNNFNICYVVQPNSNTIYISKNNITHNKPDIQDNFAFSNILKSISLLLLFSRAYSIPTIAYLTGARLL